MKLVNEPTKFFQTPFNSFLFFLNLEAAMVRVRKARNRLDWNKLQVEVISILQQRFVPNAKVLKKRLESLIDRQFMTRDENDPKIIIYIS